MTMKSKTIKIKSLKVIIQCVWEKHINNFFSSKNQNNFSHYFKQFKNVVKKNILYLLRHT